MPHDLKWTCPDFFSQFQTSKLLPLFLFTTSRLLAHYPIMSQSNQSQQWDPLTDLQIYDPAEGGVLTCSALCTSVDKLNKRCGFTLNRHWKKVR
jgi:hypothetical protein